MSCKPVDLRCSPLQGHSGDDGRPGSSGMAVSIKQVSNKYQTNIKQISNKYQTSIKQVHVPNKYHSSNSVIYQLNSWKQRLKISSGSNERDWNPGPLRFRCKRSTTELWSHWELHGQVLHFFYNYTRQVMIRRWWIREINHSCELWWKERKENKIFSWKEGVKKIKNLGSNGIRIHDLCDSEATGSSGQ